MTLPDRTTEAPPETTPPPAVSAENATPRQRAVGIGLILGSTATNQVGAALGALAFPTIGPVGVVAVRQVVAASILVPLVRPKIWRLRRSDWGPVLGLALVFSVMNLFLYLSIDRIGIALAVTLEFLGPLGVAVAGSRRARDLACAVVAGIGVVVLTNPGPSTDVLGIGAGLIAAAAWAAYILLNRSLGRRLPGLFGTASASLVTGAIWLPVATVWFLLHPPTPAALLYAAGCAVLCSVVPPVSDLITLRRVPAAMFGTLSSISPVWAALAGWVMLSETLSVPETIGMLLIVASNTAVSGQALRRSAPVTPPAVT